MKIDGSLVCNFVVKSCLRLTFYAFYMYNLVVVIHLFGFWVAHSIS